MIYAVALSAMLYAVALHWPQYLNFAIFTWMIPCLHIQPCWQAGWLWGMIFFSIHCAWLTPMISNIAYLALILYLANFTALWLWLKQQLSPKSDNRVVLFSTWIISTAIFIYLISYCSLAIFGCFEGYPFIAPQLALVDLWWFKPVLIYLGWYGSLIAILSINIGLSLLYDTSKTLFFIVLLFLAGACHEKIPSVSTDQISYLQPTWDKNLPAERLFYEIARKLDDIAINHPQIAFVMMPEAVFPYDLYAWQKYLSAWSSLFSSQTIIFVGAYRMEQDRIYNSLYAVQDGNIIGVYDKQHRMPCIERPVLLPGLHSIFASLGHAITCGAAQQNGWQVQEFDPWICSELFCRAKKMKQGQTILLVCHDEWLRFNYAKKLAVRYAKMQAIMHQVKIVYVGYEGMQILV